MKRQDGSITLEATISLVTFCLFLLFFLNFARVFRAQNVIAHGTLNAAKNMAIENYWLGGYSDTTIGSTVNAIWDLFADSARNSEDMYSSWNAAGGVTDIAKQYFVDSITDTGNRYGDADERLKSLGLENGMASLDFSETKMTDQDITVKVSYSVKLMFPFFSIGEIKMTQSSTSRLWKYQDWKFNGG